MFPVALYWKKHLDPIADTTFPRYPEELGDSSSAWVRHTMPWQFPLHLFSRDFMSSVSCCWNPWLHSRHVPVSAGFFRRHRSRCPGQCTSSQGTQKGSRPCTGRSWGIWGKSTFPRPQTSPRSRWSELCLRKPWGKRLTHIHVKNCVHYVWVFLIMIVPLT